MKWWQRAIGLGLSALIVASIAWWFYVGWTLGPTSFKDGHAFDTAERYGTALAIVVAVWIAGLIVLAMGIVIAVIWWFTGRAITHMMFGENARDA